MIYTEIDRNKARSAAVIVFFTLLVLLIGYVFGKLTGWGAWGLVFALVLSILSVLVSYYYSDSIVIAMSRAVPVDPLKYPYLANTVEGISIAAGLPMPKIYLIDDPAPNAFATGRDPKHSAICFTTGIVNMLNRKELEGVIAHEMSHVKNYDILIGSITVVLVGVVVMLSDWTLRHVRWSRVGGKGKGVEGVPGLILLLVSIALALLAPLSAQLLRLAVSRKREYLADASGALLTRYPEGLASALEKISKDKSELTVATKATAHLYIVNPLFDMRGKINDLFNTHPPTDERIKILRSM